jgi:sRNA-binding carbon storage regulator CsrA
MLILTRKPGQLLTISPKSSLNPATSIADLFRDGPIEILVSRIDDGQVRIGIHAHPDLLIVRDDREVDEFQDIDRRPDYRSPT